MNAGLISGYTPCFSMDDVLAALMSQQFTDYVLGLLRTAATAVAGAVITWRAARGVDLDASVQSALVLLIFGVSSSAYYAVAAVLERWVSRHWG